MQVFQFLHVNFLTKSMYNLPYFQNSLLYILCFAGVVFEKNCSD